MNKLSAGAPLILLNEKLDMSTCFDLTFKLDRAMHCLFAQFSLDMMEPGHKVFIYFCRWGLSADIFLFFSLVNHLISRKTSWVLPIG